METTAPAAHLTLDQVFRLALDNKSAPKAVALLHAQGVGHAFAADFKAQWAHFTHGDHELATMLANHFYRGLEKLGSPFPQLLQALLSEEAAGSAEALSTRLQSLSTHRWSFLAHAEAWTTIGSVAGGFLQQAHAVDVVEALAALMSSLDDLDHVETLLQLAARVDKSARASAYARAALALMRNGNHLSDVSAWDAIISAVVARDRQDTSAASYLVEAMQQLECVDVMSEDALQKWTTYLLHDREDRIHLSKLLKCELRERVMDLFLGKHPVLNWKDAWDVPHFLSEVLREYDDQEEAIQQILESEHGLSPQAVVEVARALERFRCSSESIWANVMTLMQGLSDEPLSQACGHAIRGLTNAKMMSEKFRQALLDRVNAIDDPLGSFRPRLLMASNADDWSRLWQDARQHLLARTWGEALNDFLFKAFGAGRGQIPAPTAVLEQIIGAANGDNIISQWCEWAFTQSDLAPGCRLLLLKTICASGHDALKRVLPDKVETLGTLAQLHPEEWAALPDNTLVPATDAAYFLAKFVARLWMGKCRNEHVWRLVQQWVKQLPDADKPWLSMSIKLALNAGNKAKWSTQAVPTDPKLDSLALDRDAASPAWSHAISLALQARPWPGQALYATALRAALVTGKLSWDAMAQVKQHRDDLQKKSPAVRWDIAFHGSESAGKMEPVSFCTSPVLFAVLQPWVKAILDVADAAIAKTSDRAALALCLKNIGLALQRKRTPAITQWGMPKGFGTLREQIFGSDPQFLISEDILSGILQKDGNATVLSKALLGELQTLRGFAPDDEKAQRLASTQSALATAIAHPDFTQQAKDYHVFDVVVADKNDARLLLLGDEMVCCLAPDGKEGEHLLERLTGGWVLVVARDQRKQIAGVAWCAPCVTSDGKAVLACDYVNLKMRLSKMVERDGETVLCTAGAATMDALVAMLPKAAKALGLAGAVFAVPQHGWMVSCHVPEGLGGKPRSLALKFMESPMQGQPFYVDHIGKPGAKWVDLG
ncbi:hypothetical protein [Piscinibacter sp. XHJ-5]|uniref:hypothetical protein n=1 Tax=Piscinibacter sp. XHJ-5 TaxID=3037797 RepID=UPI0024535D5F|nr:hypothetical protein [Piscinibacter sp. XHJ-5]